MHSVRVTLAAWALEIVEVECNLLRMAAMEAAMAIWIPFPIAGSEALGVHTDLPHQGLLFVQPVWAIWGLHLEGCLSTGPVQPWAVGPQIVGMLESFSFSF